MRAACGRARPGERGAILLLSTVAIVVALIAASLAVDLGTLAVEARRNQKVADLAALDGSRALPSDPTGAARESASRNGFDWAAPGHALTVEWAPTKAGPFSSDPGQLPVATVVRVAVTSPHENDFPFVPGGQIVTRAAVASPVGTAVGAVRVGSSAATVSSGATMLDRLLTRTVGGSYTLDAAGWNGLASGNVTFGRLRTALGLTAGSPDTVLDANLKFRQLLDATVSALNADGSPSSLTAATALAQIAAQVSATAGADVTLRRLLDLSSSLGDGADVADATLNVRDIVTGGLTVADTDHFATLDLTAADIPGLPGTGVTVRLGLIEAPRTAVGPPKDAAGTYPTVARTAQVKVLVQQRLNVSLAGGLVVLPVTVPYYLDVAYAEGRLDTLTCTGAVLTPASVDILGVTQVASTYVGAVSDASLATPGASVAGHAQLGSVTVDLGLALGSVGVTVTTTGPLASATVPGRSGHALFSPPYDGTETHPVPGATTVPLPTLASGHLAVALTGSSATLASLGLTPASVASAVVGAVNPLVSPLTNQVVAPLAAGLGLSLGNADLWAPPPQNCHSVPALLG